MIGNGSTAVSGGLAPLGAAGVNPAATAAAVHAAGAADGTSYAHYAATLTIARAGAAATDPAPPRPGLAPAWSTPALPLPMQNLTSLQRPGAAVAAAPTADAPTAGTAGQAATLANVRVTAPWAPPPPVPMHEQFSLQQGAATAAAHAAANVAGLAATSTDQAALTASAPALAPTTTTAAVTAAGQANGGPGVAKDALPTGARPVLASMPPQDGPHNDAAEPVAASGSDAKTDAEAAPSMPADGTLSQQMLALLAGSLAVTAPAPPARNAVTLPVADTSATGAGTSTAPALIAGNAASQLQQSSGLVQTGALSALLDPRATAATDTPADALKLALDVAADADAGSTFAVPTDKDDKTSLFGLSGTGAAAPTLDRPLTGNAVTATPLTMPTRPDDGFDDGLGARIGWMAEQKLGHAQIRLNPDNAGPIDVRIQLDGSQVNASFHSANAEVRQALEASLPRLREMLGQQGMQLGNTDIGQGQAQQQSGQGQPAPRGVAGGSDTGTLASPVAAPAPILVRSRGLLDEYA